MAGICAGLVLLEKKGKSGKEINSWRLLDEAELDERKSPELFRLGPLSAHKKEGWAVYTHFYGAVKGNAVRSFSGESVPLERLEVAVAFRIDNSTEDGPDCSGFVQSVCLCLSEEERITLETLDPEKRVFPEPEGGREEKAPPGPSELFFVMPFAKTQSNYVTAVGEEELRFYGDDGERLARIFLYTDTSPDIDRERYDRMLDDLVMIYEEAVSSADSTQTASRRKASLLERVREQLTSLGRLLERIAAAPEAELIEEEVRLPIEKVRRFSPKTLSDCALGLSNRVRSDARRESFDIYEHRMIRRYLELIRDLAERNAARMEELSVEETEEAWKEADTEESREKIRGLRNKFGTYCAFLQDEKNEHFFFEEPEENLYARISGQSAKLPVFGGMGENQPYAEIKPDSAVEYLADQEKLFFRYNGRQIPYATQYNITISVVGGHFFSALFFVYILEQISRECRDTEVVELFGYTLGMDRETLEERPENLPKWFPRQRNIRFSHLSRVCFGGCELRCVDFLKKLKEGDPEVTARAAELYISMQLNPKEMAAYYRDRQRERLYREREGWREIAERAGQLLGSFAFLQVPSSGEALHVTNLFLKGQGYRDIYALLCKSLLGEKGIGNSAGERIRIRAAQNVFERWALYKMLWFFTEELGFTLEGRSVADEILLYFREADLLRSDSTRLFTLKKSLPGIFGTQITLELFYQPKIYWAEGKFKTPHFVWVIQYGSRKKVFILDTKYKDFSSQSKTEWIRLLFEVAYQKYCCTIRLGRMEEGSGRTLSFGTEAELAGAYILHSDVNTQGLYFPTENGAEDRRAALSHYYGQNIRKLYEGHYPGSLPEAAEPENAVFMESCRIGSVAMMPGKMEYFMNLFRMIMEHFFGLDEKLCWNCGSSDIVRLSARKGSVGKPYRCQSCDEFWLISHCSEKDCSTMGVHTAIRKHTLNYYFERYRDHKRTWMIYCPKCGSSGVLAEEEEEDAAWQDRRRGIWG